MLYILAVYLNKTQYCTLAYMGNYTNVISVEFVNQMDILWNLETAETTEYVARPHHLCPHKA